MTQSTFTILFLAALAATTIIQLWLALRQIRHVARHRERVPETFVQRIGLAAHTRAADYTTARTRLGILETLVGVPVLLGFTLLGGLQLLDTLAAALLTASPMAAQVAFIASVIVIGAALDLPFSWYRQFGIERRFGFNRMTPTLFLADLAKGAVIAALLGLPLVMAMLWLMARAGEQWWLWAWLVWVGFNLAVLVIYPGLIAPLFNKFEPLPAGPVRERVEQLLGRCGFAARGLFVMDGSRRSSHGNAYFTGLGRYRRIVFFDTLLARLAPDEVEAVLAHELGHVRHRHVLRRIVLSFAFTLAALWVLAWLARQDWFYSGLGVAPGVNGSAALALVLFFLVLPVFAFPVQPLASLLSRRDEYQADRFAARETSAEHLASALVKLYEDNASTLTPDPLHSAFYDSHPSAAARVARLLGERGCER
ncbi:MAG: M48 family metallopeptidase [Burkholderiaceae bacterium]|nr:M48 family metallopeptidase [Burkholderiaceae bacterium]